MRTRGPRGARPRVPDPFVGWRGRRFYLHVDGYKAVLSGRKTAVVESLRKLLPAWFKVAADAGKNDLARSIAAEAEALGLECAP